MINAGVNTTNVYAIKDLFGIQVLVNGNAMNYVMLENILIMKIVSTEKNWLIYCLKYLLKILKKYIWLK